jgi:hypothetical protein
MRSFLRVHQGGELVLVNTEQIETIWATDRGSSIFFAGTDDPLHVDENIEQVMTKMTL